MGGDGPAPTASQTTGQSMQALIQYLPQLLQTASSQIQPVGQAQLNAGINLANQGNQAVASSLGTSGQQLAQAGSNLNAQTGQAGANTAANILGSDSTNRIAQSQQALDKTQNPEYYDSRSAASSKLSELLNSINLGGLSGGERAEVERSVNRDNAASGNAGTPSAIGTVSNAMNFGSALQAKQGLLSKAIDTASGFLPTSRTNFDPGGTALNAASANTTNNPGMSLFQSPNPNTGSNTLGMAQSMFGNINQAAMQGNDINANRRDTLDRVTGTLGSLPSIS